MKHVSANVVENTDRERGGIVKRWQQESQGNLKPEYESCMCICICSLFSFLDSL